MAVGTSALGLEAEPEPPGAVVGLEQLVAPNGDVLDERVIEHDGPDDLERLVDTGEPDRDGVRYIEVSGARSDGNLERRFQYIQAVRYQEGVKSDPADEGAVDAQPAAPAVVEDAWFGVLVFNYYSQDTAMR